MTKFLNYTNVDDVQNESIKSKIDKLTDKSNYKIASLLPNIYLI